uniref:PLD phosphodiesterase domain-containing protein n=1 Tax=uncultured marine virus TaxID=186617 RepID=S4TF27_9VIRU|nr:hypothetical protein [uncultured marine virus]
MPKIEPAVTTLWYQVADGVSYIDLAKDLSAINRRLYRQGYVYAVQDIQVGLPVGMRTTDVWQAIFSVVPNSYMTHNAWSKAFRAWRRQQKEITDHLGPISGKWADFKVYLDDSMEDGTILTPTTGDGGALSMGEWEHSKLVFDDDGTEREFKMHFIGSSNLADTNEESGIALIEEYADSRAYPNEEPAVLGAASNTIYAKLMGTDEMSDMLVDNAESDNDLPPYDVDDYYGGATSGDAAHPVQIAAVSANQSVSRLPGFIAPCGLIKIETTELAIDSTDPNLALSTVYADGTASTAVVGITLAVGPYRGVLATPMGQ